MSWPLLKPLNHCTNLKQWDAIDLQNIHTHTHTRARALLTWFTWLKAAAMFSSRMPLSCNYEHMWSFVMYRRSACLCVSEDDLCVIGSWSCSHWMELKKKVLWQKMIVFVKVSLILPMLVNLHKNMNQCIWFSLKAIVHPKTNILSSFVCVVPNP